MSSSCGCSVADVAVHELRIVDPEIVFLMLLLLLLLLLFYARGTGTPGHTPDVADDASQQML